MNWGVLFVGVRMEKEPHIFSPRVGMKVYLEPQGMEASQGTEASTAQPPSKAPEPSRSRSPHTLGFNSSCMI